MLQLCGKKTRPATTGAQKVGRFLGNLCSATANEALSSSSQSLFADHSILLRLGKVFLGLFFLQSCKLFWAIQIDGIVVVCSPRSKGGRKRNFNDSA